MSVDLTRLGVLTLILAVACLVVMAVVEAFDNLEADLAKALSVAALVLVVVSAVATLRRP